MLPTLVCHSNISLLTCGCVVKVIITDHDIIFNISYYTKSKLQLQFQFLEGNLIPLLKLGWVIQVTGDPGYTHFTNLSGSDLN